MPEAIAFTTHMNTTYEQALQKVTAALKQEGFGVLTQIDVQAALQKKIGVDFRPYSILGACNPDLAYQALSHSPQMGLMLPCNVTVEQATADRVTVRIIDPVAMMKSAGMGEDRVLAQIALQARERLERVAQSLSSS